MGSRGDTPRRRSHVTSFPLDQREGVQCFHGLLWTDVMTSVSAAETTSYTYSGWPKNFILGVSITETWGRLAIPCPCVRRLHVMTSVVGVVTYVLPRCVPPVPIAGHHVSDAHALGKSMAWIADTLPGFPHQSEVCCQMIVRLWQCKRLVKLCRCCCAHIDALQLHGHTFQLSPLAPGGMQAVPRRSPCHFKKSIRRVQQIH